MANKKMTGANEITEERILEIANHIEKLESKVKRLQNERDEALIIIGEQQKLIKSYRKDEFFLGVERGKHVLICRLYNEIRKENMELKKKLENKETEHPLERVLNDLRQHDD